MQIHELNTFPGIPGDTDFLAIDTGFDTAKISVPKLYDRKVNQPLDENNQPDNGNEGDVLRTKGNGHTEWAPVGQPTDEQTAQAVSDWLDAHPEATTTVADGSLTEPKFANSLKLKTIKDYVTPEMFGAAGDGVTDDSVAFANACSVADRVVGLPGNYLISVAVPIAKNVSIIGGRDSNIILANNNARLKINRYDTLEGFNVKIPLNFTGAVFEISNATLDDPDQNTNNTGIFINNIVVRNVSTPTIANRGTGCIFDIHMDQVSSNYAGFWDVTITNIKFVGAIKYFCKEYVETGGNNRWITDVRFNKIIIDSCDYAFFGAISENDTTNYRDVMNLVLDDISMQWNTSKLFAYFTSGYKTMKIVNIWDRPSVNIPVKISQNALSDSLIRIDAIPESPYTFFEVENMSDVLSHYFIDKLVYYDTTFFRGVRNVKNMLEFNNYFRFLSKSASGSNLYFQADIAMKKRATYAIHLTFFDDNGQHNVTIRPYWWNTWNCKYICDTDFMDNKTLYCKVEEDIIQDYNSCSLILKFAAYPSNLIFYQSISKGEFDSDVVFDEISGTPSLTGYVQATSV